MAGSAEALERFERQTAWPMLILSFAIIPLLVVPLVMNLSPGANSTFFAIDLFIWAVFALEYGIRLYLAPVKGRFVRSNVIDLLVVLVPFLRPLRVAASVRMLRLLRAGSAAVLLLRATKALRNVLTRHKLHYTLLVASVVTVAAGLIVAEVERGAPEANIESIPDGLWWAVTTVTTVGYGDTLPTTAVGRSLAVVLALVGVGLFGLSQLRWRRSSSARTKRQPSTQRTRRSSNASNASSDGSTNASLRSLHPRVARNLQLGDR